MNWTAFRAMSAGGLGAICAFAAPGSLALEPANLQLGPLYITPTLDLETYYTDNLWLTNSQEKDTWVGVVTPRVQAWLHNGPSDYSFTLQAKDSTYASSDDDDFTDYTATLDLRQQFNARNKLYLYAEKYDGHEDRGTGFIEGDLSFVTDKPVEYDRDTLGGDYTYGTIESRGRIKLAARSEDFKYQNYEYFTRFYDRREDMLSGTFYWKVAQRTDALLQVRAIDNNYDRTDPSSPDGSLSSDEMNYLVGVDWAATGKLSGHAKAGMYERDYRSSARDNEDGFLWEVGLVYRPRTYSSFDLKTRRYYQEPNGLGDGINTKTLDLLWSHNWNQRSSTHLTLIYSNDDYEGADREDNNYGAEARFDYAFRRWADLGVGYRYQDRDSDIEEFDYRGNTFFLEARLSL